MTELAEILAELNEAEKDSDREWAQKILILIRGIEKAWEDACPDTYRRYKEGKL